MSRYTPETLLEPFPKRDDLQGGPEDIRIVL